MEQKEIDRIIKRSPKITKEISKEVNEDFKRYIFYENTETGREFTCSHCNKKYTVSKKHPLLKKRHNNFVTCPKCGAAAVLKGVRLSRKCIELFEYHNYAYFIPGKDPEKEVWIIAFTAQKSYKAKKKDNLEFIMDSIYLITPSGARHFINHYGWYTGNYNWVEETSLLEPFFLGSRYENYIPAWFNLYKETFLRYSGFDLWRFGSKCRYLAMYPTHRAYEMLLKMGIDDFVKESVISHKDNKRIINWNANKPKDIFKIPRTEIMEANALMKTRGRNTVDFLKLYNKVKKFLPKITLEEMDNIIHYVEFSSISVETLVELLQQAQVTPRRFLNYIDKIYERGVASMHCARYNPTKTQVSGMYFDYLDIAIELEYDLSQEVVLMPKDMVKAHDVATDTFNAIQAEARLKYEEERRRSNEKRAAELQTESDKLYKKRSKQYLFESDCFAIVLPKELQDIVREGQELRHCVGGYVERHAKGQCTILFLRDKKNIDKPLYTIEMHDKKLQQVQGYANRTPLTPEAKVFFEEWLKWIESGSPRNKKGEPKSKAAITAA